MTTTITMTTTGGEVEQTGVAASTIVAEETNSFHCQTQRAEFLAQVYAALHAKVLIHD